MAIEEVSDMFSDLIILVFESTSLVGTRSIRNEYFGLLEFVWQHGFTLLWLQISYNWKVSLRRVRTDVGNW